MVTSFMVGTPRRAERVGVRRTCAVAVAAAVAIGVAGEPASPPGPKTDVSSALSSATPVNLLATQAALLMNGTFTPFVTPEFVELLLDAYIVPLAGSGYEPVPLTTPEQLWPFSGPASLTYNDSTREGYQILETEYRRITGDNAAGDAPGTPMLVLGYSQSAFIASLFAESLGQDAAGGAPIPPTTFIQIGNTNIPNGGLMARFNGLGLTPWTPVVSSPTATGSLTYEVLRQYDPFSDFPAYPLNLLAVVNSLMGYLLHFTLPISGSPPWLTPVINILNRLITPISLNPESPNYVEPVVSRYQDTVYLFVPTAELPLLDPLRWIGLSSVADALDPVLRPLIEAGYDRTASLGVPTPAYFGFPPDFGVALRQSWEALLGVVNPGRSAPAAATAASVAATAPAPITPAVSDSVGAGEPRGLPPSPPPQSPSLETLTDTPQAGTPGPPDRKRPAARAPRSEREGPAARAARPENAAAATRASANRALER
jgi:hypothetical protein